VLTVQKADQSSRSLASLMFHGGFLSESFHSLDAVTFPMLGFTTGDSRFSKI